MIQRQSLLSKNLSSLFVVSAVLLSACTLSLPGFKSKAALKVTANPNATVILNGEELGTTPYYDEALEPGDYTLKLVPTAGDGVPWEALIKLTPAIVTTVSRELAQTYDKSSGYQLSMESKASGDVTASLMVVTVPDGALVSLDGESKGFAPLVLEKLVAGDHVLVVSSPGYVEKSIQANLAAGHKLTASVHLARAMDTLTPSPSPKGTSATPSPNSESKKTPEPALDEDITVGGSPSPKPKASVSPKPSPSAKASPSPKPSPTPKPAAVGADLEPPYIEVLDTPTGWLNVRKTPSSTAEIITKIYPKSRYTYLDKNDSGWDQIQIDDQKGWVSSKYVKLVE